MILKLLVTISNVAIAQPLCEAAVTHAGLDPAALCSPVAAAQTGYVGGGVVTGMVWTHDLPPADVWRALAAWADAGAVRSVELAPWTAAIDPRATALVSWRLVPPLAVNPYGLPVFLIAGEP